MLWKTRLVIEVAEGHKVAPQALSIVLNDAERDPRETRVDLLKWLAADALDGLATTLEEHRDVYGTPETILLFIEPQLDMDPA